MGLFGRKKPEEKSAEKSEEEVLKENLEGEVASLQSQFREKETELKEIKEKIEAVKGEYDLTVSNLMRVKKELNQKTMELDGEQRKFREIREKIKSSEQIKDSKEVTEFNQTKERHSKMKGELEDFTRKFNEMKEQMAKDEKSLSIVRKQQLETEKELEEANTKLYNAKKEIEEKGDFAGAEILTQKEKEIIQGGQNDAQKGNAGIIEAASVVVGSFKSKLNMTQKELEALQTLLEKEREEHKKTRQELEALKTSMQES